MYRAVNCSYVLIIVLFLAIAASAQSTVPEGAVPSTVGSTVAKPAGAAGTNQSSVAPATQPTLFTRAKADDELRIGSGDLLEVNVFGASDYTHVLRVADDGSITLPLIGQVQVAGLTSRELSSDLQKRLKQGGYFNNPEVGVFVKEYASQGVSVLGEVQKPGVYPLVAYRWRLSWCLVFIRCSVRERSLTCFPRRRAQRRPLGIKCTSHIAISRSNRKWSSSVTTQPTQRRAMFVFCRATRLSYRGLVPFTWLVMCKNPLEL